VLQDGGDVLGVVEGVLGHSVSLIDTRAPYAPEESVDIVVVGLGSAEHRGERPEGGRVDHRVRLIGARRLALPALEQLGDWLLDDVCVPRSRVVDLVEAVETIAADLELTIGVFGHAGDGNLHPTVIFDQRDEATRDAARTAFDRITGAALALGGTITGEHGVGQLKRAWLDRELDPVAPRLHRDVRRVFDPAGVLNPAVAPG
jgi:glycolate oxidase